MQLNEWENDFTLRHCFFLEIQQISYLGTGAQPEGGGTWWNAPPRPRNGEKKLHILAPKGFSNNCILLSPIC